MILIPTTRTRFDGREVPSPAMIRRRAEAIQKHWSFRTRLKRAGVSDGKVGLVEIVAPPRRKGYHVDA